MARFGLCLAFLTLLASTFLAEPGIGRAAAETRVALVIGNSAYTAVPRLENPSRDAAAIGRKLEAAGFQSVDVETDLTHDGMVKALRGFEEKADKADWAVVYYAGHGIELGGANYLVPVDARLASDRDVQDEAVSLDRVLAAVENTRKLRIVILDACRNDPFANLMKRTGASRSIGRGLAKVEPDTGTLVAFAAKQGETAEDGDGTDSPFVASLLKRLDEPGVEISKLFRQVRDDVLAATGKRQEPAIYASLPGEDFFFKPGAPDAVAVVGPKAPVAEPAISPCDTFAGDPDDKARPANVPGVALADIDLSSAAIACTAAYQQDPQVRYAYGLMRVLEKMGQREQALGGYRSLSDKGYDAAKLAVARLTGGAAPGAAAVDLAGMSPDAINTLGIAYYQGSGGKPQDKAQAVRLFRIAADRGVRDAMHNAADVINGGAAGVPANAVEGAKYYLKCAEAGDTYCMWMIGDRYLGGQAGMPKDRSKARAWYRRSADGGDQEGAKHLHALDGKKG